MSNKKNNAGPFEQVIGMWNGRGKVAFTAFVKEDITIPAGAKLLAFRNDNANPSNRQPAIRLVYVMEEQ